MLPISKLAGILAQAASTGGGGATSFTLSGSTSGTTNSPTTFTVTPNGPLLATTTVTITAPSATRSTSSLSFTGGSSSPQTFTVTRTTDGTTSVSIANSGGLTNVGSPISFTSTTVSAADWTTRSTGPSVVWAHNFESDTEVTAHLLSGQTLDSAKARRVIDSSGIGCLEQITLGATLAASYTAGSTTMTINDTTYWPDPAVVGTYQIVVCDPPPTVGRKNLFNVTAKSGSVLTVNLEPNASSAFVIVGGGSFAQVAQSYAIGAIVGSEASDWRRTFAALPAGENGKATDDPGASGAVPLRSKLTGNAYSVPRDPSLWQYGWYGHPSNQTTWANWTGWQGTSSITPRGVSQGAAAKFRLWDGDEFFIQWRMKLDPRFYANHAQSDPNGEDDYWGRKSWAIQSELSSLNQIVAGVATSNRYSIPSTTKTPFGLSTYKAARILGLSDNPSRITSSQQPNSPWDIAPHFANLSSSFKPSTGLATPDGSTAWELPDNEWVTFYMRVKPGRSNVGDTEIEVKFARTEDPAYNGTYTTLLSLTDARIVYSGSGDYEFPDGAFSYPTVTTMNALPGFQSFGIMGYLNITQSAGLPPPKASYYIRMAQVIFSKAAIPAPSVTPTVPSWVPAAGELTTLTVANGGLTNDFRDVVSPNYQAYYSVKIINDYSGAAKNPYYGNLGASIFFGGGHAGTNDNSTMALVYGQTSCTFKRISDPTNYFPSTPINNDVGNISSVIDSDWLDEPGNFKPANIHAWGLPVIIPPSSPGAGALGSLCIPMLAAAGAIGLNKLCAHELSIPSTSVSSASIAWARTSTTSVTPGTAQAAPPACAFVPAQNRVYFCFNGGGDPGSVYWLDRATGNYITGTGVGFNYDGADQAISGDASAVLFHVPERDLLIRIGRFSGVLNVQYMDVSAGVTQPTVGGAVTLSSSLAVPVSWSTATWCPDNSRIIIAGITGDAGAMYEIEIPTNPATNPWAVTRAPLGSGQTFTPVDPAFGNTNSRGKFDYDRNVRAIVYFGSASYSGSDTVYVYRPRGT